MRRPGPPSAPAPLRGVFVVALATALAACGREPSYSELPRAEAGEPIPGISDDQRGRFLVGRALFERITAEEEGLGPLFNARRCSDCHDVPRTGGGGERILVVKATRFEDDRCDLLVEVGGDNIQQQATGALQAHGLGPETIPQAANGSAFVTAPSLMGLGLVEAVADAVLEEWADPDDRDGDGISGRLPRLADGRSGRFGRKGDAHDLAGFIDTALRFELGLTTPDFPSDEGPNGAPLPDGVDPMPDPEMDARGLALLADYVRFLAPPPRATPDDEATASEVRRGEEVFREVGCAGCHRPELRTGPDAPPPLGGRVVRAWSDFLVHDLGRARGDVCGIDARPGEIRTATLWGLRHRGRYMHDNAAADLEAAIGLHGGEAAPSRDAFLGAPARDRALLVRFLESL